MAPIFLENADYILEVMDTMLKNECFQKLIINKDINGWKRLWWGKQDQENIKLNNYKDGFETWEFIN